MAASSNSRRRGMALMGAVVLVLLLIPSLHGRRVGGDAVAVPVPGPPAVGDCVDEPIDPTWNQPWEQDVATGPGSYVYPRVAINHCDGSRFGEITGLISRPVTPEVTITRDSTSSSANIVDSNMDTCTATSYRYAGLPMSELTPGPLQDGWYPQMTVGAAAIRPSLRQAAAGQRWLACMVYLRGQPGDIDSNRHQQEYTGTVKDALSTGSQRDRTGTCVPTSDLNGGQIGDVPCTATHQGEVLAYKGKFDHPVPRADAERSCLGLVARLTAIPDLTAAGLAVRLQVVGSDGVAADVDPVPAGSIALCGVNALGKRFLTGSLLALGDQPVPWGQ